MKVLIPGTITDLMELDTVIKQGGYKGMAYIGPERQSYAYEMTRKLVEQFADDCEYRASKDWENEWKEKVVYARVAKRLRAMLTKPHCPDPSCAAPLTPWTRGGTRACSAKKCPGEYSEYDATKDKTKKGAE